MWKPDSQTELIAMISLPVPGVWPSLSAEVSGGRRPGPDVIYVSLLFP
jgi:hypothetical protein